MQPVVTTSALLVSSNRSVGAYFRLHFVPRLPLVRIPSILRALVYLKRHQDADTVYIDSAAYSNSSVRFACNIIRKNYPELTIIFVVRTKYGKRENLEVGDLYHTIPEHITA